MPKIAYIGKRFRKESLQRIHAANLIIDEYQQQGFKLTLRQLYYQFVSRDWLPNTQKAYKQLGDVVNDARLAGLIDWSAIEDRTRNMQSNSHWDEPGEIIQACSQQFKLDLWEGQDYYCEVWIEKEALVGVIEKVCRELDISYFACRGYVSQSEMWAAARRLIEMEQKGRQTVIFHFGDHDPSGIDMTRDIQDRLQMFESEVEVRRIALTMDQIEDYSSPPNPAKATDARFEAYLREYGDESWELDALEPRSIVDLIELNVGEIVDWDLRDQQIEAQGQAREELSLVSEQWDRVVKRLKK